MKPTLLIIEDEVDLAEALQLRLEGEGFATRVAHAGLDGLAMFDEDPAPAAVILDLMLPDIPGSEVCRRIRAHASRSRVPVLMLTARSDEVDRVVGFEVGADDYVTKPYSPRELVLRIRALLRRAAPAEATEAAVMRFGLIVMDEEAFQVTVDGEPVRLTALEFRLLKTFMERRGRVQTRDRLLGDVWGYAVEVTTRTVDTHVKRLREKLGPASGYIETLRGVGYRMRAKVD